MKFVISLSLILCSATFAWAEESPWAGKWEFERYAYAVGGVLNINNCHKSKCNFEIFTSHGSHSCNVQGTMIIDGNIYCPKFRESKKMRDETRFRCKLS